MADRSVSVRLRGDVTHFVNQLKRAGREVDDLARKARGIGPVRIRVEVDDQTGPALTSIERRLQGLGPVKVRVEIDDQTQSDISAISARLASLGPVDIALRIDDQTAASIAAVEARLRSLGPIDIGVRLDNQTSGSLAALRARLNSLGPYMVRVGLDVQTAALAVLQARIAALGPYDVPVGLNLQPGALAALRARLASLGPFQVQIELELDPWAINDIRTRLAALGGVSVPINAHFDGHAGLAASWAEFERFRLLASRLLNIPVTAHDNLDVGLGQAYAEMLMFRQLAERTLRIPVTTSGGVNFPNLGSLGSAAGSLDKLPKNVYLVAAAIAALPALSVAAGGAITLGIGGAISALPVLAWQSSAKVKEAYSGLFGEIKSGIRAVSPEWEDHITGWAQTVRDLGTNWSNTLEGVFTQVGPALTGFWDDMRLGLNELRPTFAAAGDAFAALLGALGPQLPDIFGAFGDGLERVFAAVQANPEYVGDLLYDMGQLVDVIGAVIGVAYDSYPAFHAMFSGLSLIADAITAIKDNDLIAPLLTGIGGMIGKINDLKTSSGGANAAADALASLDEGLLAASDGTNKLTGSQGGLVDIMQTAGMTADDLKTKLDNLTNKTLDRREGQRGFEAALDDLTKSLKENGGTLDEHTDKGRKNGASVDAVAKKYHKYMLDLKESSAGPAVMARETDKARKAIIAAGMAAGWGEKRSKALADSILGVAAATKKIPKSKNIKIAADTERAKAEVEAVTAWINNQLATITVRTTHVGGIGQLTPKEKAGNADGNVWVPNAHGSVRTFAQGSEHHVAQIARPGEWRVWAEDETGGEAYIPLAGSKRARSEAILGDVANRFGLNLTRPMADGGVTFFADGGVTDAPLSGMLGSWRDLVKPTTAEDLKDALEARNDQAQSLADALEDLKAAKEARVEAIKEAQESLAQAKADRSESIREAKKRLSDAKKDRAESIKEAKKRLAETRQSRKEAIADAKRGLRDAREQRADAIRQAKADLAEARKSTGKGKAAKIADAQRKLTRAQRTDDVEKAQRDLKKASTMDDVKDAQGNLSKASKTDNVKDAQADLVKAQKDNRVAKAQDELADAKRVAGLKAIEQAERRIRDARVDLAEATEKLLSVEDRRQFDLMRPGDQLSAALALGIRNTGAFIANLTALGDRGFGNLANQLLGMGGAEAEKLAADLASMPDWQVGNTQKQIETSQQQQAQLAALPETLKVRSALKAGGGSGWTNLLMATDLDPGTLAAVLKTMPDVGNTDQGKALLADMAKHGYASGGWVGGIGGPTSDSNLIAASRNEFMVAAGPARKHGALLEAINDGRMPAVPRYASGGWVGRPRGGDGAAAAPSMHLEQHFHEVPFTPSQMAREAAREAAWAIR